MKLINKTEFKLDGSLNNHRDKNYVHMGFFPNVYYGISYLIFWLRRDAQEISIYNGERKK